MKRMHSRALLCAVLLVSVMLGGCASVQKQDQKVHAEPEPDRALVYFLREKKFLISVVSQ